MRTTHLGPEDLLVAAKLEFDAGLAFAEVAEEIDAATKLTPAYRAPGS